MKTAKVIETLNLNNREFILSSEVRPCGKIGFYAHELGKLTQWAEVLNTGERKAHQINPSMRVKGRRFIARPFNTLLDAKNAAIERSNTKCWYS